MVARFSANVSENCSEAGSKWEAVGQQREIQNHASLLVQLSTGMDDCLRMLLSCYRRRMSVVRRASRRLHLFRASFSVAIAAAAAGDHTV